MIRFGHTNADETWGEASLEVVDEVQSLLYQALAAPQSPEAPVRIKIYPGEDALEVSAGTHCQVELSAFSAEITTDQLGWSSAGGEQRPGPLTLMRVRLATGLIAAGLVVQADRVYRAGDIIRALQSSFDTGRRRPGRYVTLGTYWVERARMRPLRLRDSLGSFGLFYCHNPICSARNVGVLIERAPGQRPWAQGCAIAYPCPSCPGTAEQAWALSYDREARGQQVDGVGNLQVLEYRIHPEAPRGMPVAGPVAHVIGHVRDRQWASTWNAETVHSHSEVDIDFIRRPNLRRLELAAHASPHIGGLLAALLDSNNLRAFVDYCRLLAPEEKSESLAGALARAYAPRRVSNYKNSEDRAASAAQRYHYVAYSPEAFLRQLRAFGVLDHPGRFLDVGSGTGEKPFLAYALGAFERCDGLEINSGTVAIANFLSQSIEPSIAYPIEHRVANALEFDDYGSYDVIYMYRPFRETRLMGRLMRHIGLQLAPGAVVFDVLDGKVALRRGPDGYQMRDVSITDHLAWTSTVSLDEFIAARDLL